MVSCVAVLCFCGLPRCRSGWYLRISRRNDFLTSSNDAPYGTSSCAYSSRSRRSETTVFDDGGGDERQRGGGEPERGGGGELDRGGGTFGRGGTLDAGRAPLRDADA